MVEEFLKTDTYASLIREDLKKIAGMPDYMKDFSTRYEDVLKSYSTTSLLDNVKKSLGTSQTLYSAIGKDFTSSLQEIIDQGTGWRDWAQNDIHSLMSSERLDYMAKELEDTYKSLKSYNFTEGILKNTSSVIQDSIKSYNLYTRSLNSKISTILEEENISPEELNSTLYDFFSRIEEPNFFDNFTVNLKKLKKPIRIIAVAIFNDIRNIIFSILLIIYQQDIINFYNKTTQHFKSKREITQHIKKSRSEIDVEKFKEYRFVTADSLNLREKPNTKSKILDQLDRARIVKIVEKRRKWALVEVYYEDTDESFIGWVSTRYIIKLTK